MPRGGALDKLFLQFLTRCRSLPIQFSHLMPRKRKVPGALRPGPNNGSIPATPAVASQQSLTKSSPNPETRGAAMDFKQGGMQVPINSGWRPYKGRWDAKVAYRGNRAESPQHKNANNGGQSLRRGRQRQQTKGSGQQSNGPMQLYSGQPGRSLSPRRDLPPQTYHQPHNNGPINAFSMGDALADYSFWSPFAMFGGAPMHMDSSVFAQQQSFFTPNISEQLMQSQFLQQPSLPNLPFPPLPGGGSPYMPMPPFLPSAAPIDSGPDIYQAVAAPTSTGFDNLTVPSPGLVANPPPLPLNQSRPGPANTSKRPIPKSPSATKNYLHQSSLAPTSTSTPQPLLVILDLNGTLIFRKTRKFPPSFSRRVGLDDFLNTLIEKYKVMIWSSSQPPTVDAVCQKLFTEPKRKELVAEWGRDKLGLSKSEYNSKIQVYKTLDTVWSSRDVQASYPNNGASESNDTTSAGTRWDQSNTILIDDSKLKAVSEPYNLIEIPEFTNAPGVDESYIFPKVLQLLEILAKCDDVSKMLHVWDSRASGTGIINLDVNSLHLEPGVSLDPQHELKVDPAQARLDKRKSRKKEKKAAKQAAAILAAKAAVRAQGNSQSQDHQSAFPTHAGSIEETQKPLLPKLSEANERSVSPASVQSENFLLDRLEESLNSR